MRLKEFQQITEVPMNPTAFAQGIDTGAEKGVKVGFEFEVCVPRDTIKQFLHKEDEKKKYTWCDYVTDNYGQGAWSDAFDLTELDAHEVEIRQPIVFNKKTFTVNDFGELVSEWVSTKIKDQVEAVFNSCSTPTKRKIVAAWDKYKNNYNTRDNVLNFSRTARRILPAKDTETYIKFIRAEESWEENIDKREFWLEIFGTNDLFELAKDPRIQFIDDNMAELVGYDGFGDNEDDNEYGGWVGYSYDYSGAHKVLEPEIRKAFGQVVVFSEYHEDRKDTKSWYIEPDGSLEPESGDGAAEVVTPPLPVKQAVEALKTFYGIAKKLNLYTSAEHGTGLHINVSIPEKLDVLKLAVFVGDQHVLKSWGRENNEYVDSVIATLKKSYGSGPSSELNAPKFNPSIKKHYKELLDIAKEVSDNHEASVNFNGKYVSFRHAGGDYLNQQQSVVNVIGRFVRAMVIASNPNLYRKEYLAKLVKLSSTEKTAVDKVTSSVEALMSLKTTPLNARLYAVYGTIAAADKSELERYMLANSSTGNPEFDLAKFIAPFNIAKPYIDNILKKGIDFDNVDNYAKKGIKKYPEKQSLIVLVSTIKNSPTLWQDDIGYMRRRGINLSIGEVLLPGTPLHTLAFKSLVSAFKNKMGK